MNKKQMTFRQNEKIDFLFGTFGGEYAPTKQDKFKPIEVIEIDENGREKILKDFYIKKPGKHSVIEFEKLIKNIASEYFSEKNRIKKPNHVEILISFSITEKRFKEVDIDNLSKTVLDALNGIAFDDDSQVTSLIASKHVHQMRINGLFIGITKLTEKRQGFGGDIKLFDRIE